MKLLPLALAGLALGACARGPAPDVPLAGEPELTIDVAALGLAGVKDVVWDVEVLSGGGSPAVVWQRRLTSSTYGDGRGSASFVGPCDAAGGANTVRVWVVGLYDGAVSAAAAGAFAAGDDAGVGATSLAFDDPTADGPLEKPATCAPNADNAVRFDVTLMRPADHGFFDVAVTFDDIFCSAKLDCVPEMLHRPGGARDLTAVLAFACTSGGDTCLYADPVTLACDNGSWTVDPAAGPGNVAVAGPVLYGAAVYRGDEAYTAFEKQYWNVALGIDEAALAAAGDCTLTWGATASEGYWPDRALPAVSAYPVVTWSRQIVTDGALTCGSHPLNVVASGEAQASVRTEYARDAPRVFAASSCAPAEEPEPSSCDCPEGYTPNVDDTACVRELVTTPTSGGSLDVCAGFSEPWINYTYRGARFSTVLTPSAFEFVSPLEPGCTDPSTCVEVSAAPWTGRLNDVGVWACPGPDHETYVDPPFNQWIGFSRCIDIANAGEYMVGIAGDNHVMLRLDGQTLYQSVSSENFRAWNVLKVTLSAGTHTVELFGLNLDTLGSFGAEIAGPFPVGTLDTPAQMAAADYVGHIIFSTAPMRAGGSQFQVSTGASAATGLTCPDGFALELCDTPAVCVDRDETYCGIR
ncbi:MAG: hypothetical protein KC635_03850 [Myxococcales bacterium]|nr:hypothetical protein [Myxococcales bacterium]